jgi:hypothetical protein
LRVFKFYFQFYMIFLRQVPKSSFWLSNSRESNYYCHKYIGPKILKQFS